MDLALAGAVAVVGEDVGFSPAGLSAGLVAAADEVAGDEAGCAPPAWAAATNRHDTAAIAHRPLPGRAGGRESRCGKRI